MQSKTERSTTSKPSRRLIVAAACLSSVLAGTGCRSSSGWTSPSLHSFGWKKEPSADALAGKGPTVTYPTSPAAGQTPAAISSIAASPSGAQPQTSQLADNVRPAPSGAVAANPVSPATATPNGPAINPAAAAANGYPSYAATTPNTAKDTPAADGATAGAGTPNGGYVFGQNPAAPGALAQSSGNTNAAASFAQAGTAPSGTAPSAAAPSFGTPATAAVNSPTQPSSAYTAVGYPMPAKSQSLASQAAAEASAEQTPSAPTASPSLGDGFALPPGGLPAPSNSNVAKGGFVMPGMDSDESDAGEAEAKTAAAPKANTVAPVSGYAPGSTGGSAGYPTTTAGGDDSGGFYR